MRWKDRLRALFLCLALEAGVLAGVPMRPEQIRDLMRQMNQPIQAHVLPTEDDSGDNGQTRSDTAARS
jgi:hypothetical protein